MVDTGASDIVSATIVRRVAVLPCSRKVDVEYVPKNHVVFSEKKGKEFLVSCDINTHVSCSLGLLAAAMHSMLGFDR